MNFTEIILTVIGTLVIAFFLGKIGFMRTKEITAPIQVVFEKNYSGVDIVHFFDLNNTKNKGNVEISSYSVADKKLSNFTEKYCIVDLA